MPLAPDRLRALLAEARLDLRGAARLLGYASDNSLRQCLDGKATLPPDRAAWLESYARLRTRHARAEAAWLEKNPAPGRRA